jgi:S1-C subfamily serine protease
VRHSAFFAVIVMALITLNGCTTPRDIKPVAVRAPIANVDRSKLATVQLDRVVVTIPRGTEIGAGYSLPLICPGRGPIYWNTGRITDRSVAMRDIFFSALTSANLRVVGDPEKMFEERRERPEFLVGAQVTKIAMNVCNRDRLIWDMRDGLKFGEASIDVTWQVFSNLEQRVVRTFKTQGYAKVDEAVPDGDVLMLENAFSAAANNLAATPDFVDLLRRDRPTSRFEPAPVSDAPLRLAGLPLLGDAIGRSMPRIRDATATLLDGPDGHGSGFFVSEQGYLLTNYHVVGEGETVPVRLSNGTTITGHVLRRNRPRDIALVKVDAVGTRALPIRTKPVTTGEEVYALGTPLDRGLSNSLTRGIVNAVRQSAENGLVLIQSDALIEPGNSGGPLLDASGNVVGVSVSTLAAAPGKINFFIPIQDALEKLRLEIAP